jgi:capsular exopolysaccharide synthesis family protein
MSKIYEALLRAEWERLTPEEQKQYEQDAESFPSIASLVGRPAVAVPPASVETSSPEAAAVREHHRAPRPLGAVATSTWKPDLEKLPALQSRSALTEQFRSLRSRLYEYRGFNKLKTILVCSGVPREGKTFVAANLALSLARYKNSKILLIDADLRKNSLHTLLGCSAAPGLSTYLSGEATALEVMQRSDLQPDPNTMHPAVLSGITFIGGGAGGEGAADLSGNNRFAELIRFAEPHFDWIIVDSSPVNVVSDAVNLAPACDGVLLVVRGGVTPYQTAQLAQKQFGTANLLGVVLNAVANAPHQSYYGYGTEPEQ